MALATPMGESAIALIRVSGPLAAPITQTAFKLEGTPPARSVKIGYYQGVEGHPLDHCAYSYFEAPRSYTGEAMLEINCHGNPLIINRLMADLIKQGCRVAEPGEFTRRAFENGKIDLTQAEAIADLIRAKSDRAILLAQRQLQGALGERVHELVDQVLNLLAQTEAYIDFPEEDLPPEDKEGPLQDLSKVIASVKKLLRNRQQAPLLCDGIKTVIIGAPNAGKSSLLNILAGHERALVSAEPGTTRDYIVERIIIGQYSLQLVDTAGIRESDNPLEAQGIERAIQQAEAADFYIGVFDQSAPWPDLPQSLLDRLTSERTLLIINKCDLSCHPHFNIHPALAAHTKILLSLKTGQGIDDLASVIQSTIENQLIHPSEDDLLINTRHGAAISKAYEHLNDAKGQDGLQKPVELMASDLRLAIDALGEITGKIENEQILDRLFGNFCIGK